MIIVFLIINTKNLFLINKTREKSYEMNFPSSVVRAKQPMAKQPNNSGA